MKALVLAVAVLGSACASMHATPSQLAARASFDLDCPEGQLEVVEIDQRTRGVRGCGRRAAYVETCKACANGYPACECTWMLNADVQKPVLTGSAGIGKATASEAAAPSNP